jgi:hypothetical protein
MCASQQVVTGIVQDLLLSRGDCFCAATTGNPFISVGYGLFNPFVPEFTQETGLGQKKQYHILPCMKVQGTA